MNVVVLNASPKGEYSITLQSVLYLKMKYTRDSFTIWHVGKKADVVPVYREEIFASLAKADVVLFAYPVLGMWVPGALQQFLEQWRECAHGAYPRFGAWISTSHHLYDTLAAGYLKKNLKDLGIHPLGGHLAGTEDFLQASGRRKLLEFWAGIRRDFFRLCMGTEVEEGPAQAYTLIRLQEDVPRLPPDPIKKTGTYRLEETKEETKQDKAKDTTAEPSGGNCLSALEELGRHMAKLPPLKAAGGKWGKRDGLLLWTDCGPHDEGLYHIIRNFCEAFPYRVYLVNARDLSLFSSQTSLESLLNKAGGIVYVHTIRYHGFSAVNKLAEETIQFRFPLLEPLWGLPVMYLLAGELERESHLRIYLEARAEMCRQALRGTVLSSVNTSDEKKLWHQAAEEMVQAVRCDRPGQGAAHTFWGEGGGKILRDVLYAGQGQFPQLHAFYRKQGLYDFPYRNWKGIMWTYIQAILIRQRTGRMPGEGDWARETLKPYKAILRQ